MENKPNPGSEEAVQAGCTCPVMDNAHGKGVAYSGVDNAPLFWISGGCPLHGTGDPLFETKL